MRFSKVKDCNAILPWTAILGESYTVKFFGTKEARSNSSGAINRRVWQVRTGKCPIEPVWSDRMSGSPHPRRGNRSDAFRHPGVDMSSKKRTGCGRSPLPTWQSVSAGRACPAQRTVSRPAPGSRPAPPSYITSCGQRIVSRSMIPNIRVPGYAVCATTDVHHRLFFRTRQSFSGARSGHSGPRQRVSRKTSELR